MAGPHDRGEAATGAVAWGADTRERALALPAILVAITLVVTSVAAVGPFTAPHALDMPSRLDEGGQPPAVANGPVSVDTAGGDHRERAVPDAPSASTRARDATPSPTTPRTDDGLGTALAYAAILLLTGLGLLAAVLAGIALAIGRLLTDWFEQWETGTLAAALVSGLYAAVRGFTLDLSAGDSYYLGTYAALGAAGLLIAWLLGRVSVWFLRWSRKHDTPDQAGPRGDEDTSESDPEGGRDDSGGTDDGPDE